MKIIKSDEIYNWIEYKTADLRVVRFYYGESWRLEQKVSIWKVVKETGSVMVKEDKWVAVPTIIKSWEEE